MWAVSATRTARCVRCGPARRRGAVRQSQTFTDPSWRGGVLHVVVAPRAGTRWVEAETAAGEPVRRAPEDVTGYEPENGE